MGFVIGMSSPPALADVTGSFRLEVGFGPLDCRYLALLDPITGEPAPFGDQPCEGTVFKFDVQTEISFYITVSGLTAGLHTHTGATGFEDIIISFATTLGALDIADTFVFAQPFADGILITARTVPVCLEEELGSGICPLLFVKKRVEMALSLGGMTLSNLTMFEDVAFPNYCRDAFVGDLDASFYDLFGCVPPVKGVDTGLTYSAQSQQFGFGDVITLEGQTPSGITVIASTGICAEQLINATKKHAWPYSVNRDCYGGVQSPSVKPPLLFSFESLRLEGIPVAQGLSADAHVRCGSIQGSAEAGSFFPCAFEGVWTLQGSPLFDSLTLTLGAFDPLGAGTLEDIELQASGGPMSLLLRLSPSGLSPTFVFFTATFPLNPDTYPGELRLRVQGVPSLVGFDLRLRVWRAGLRLEAELGYDVNPLTQSIDFDRLTVSAQAEAGTTNLDASITVLEGGTDPETAFLLGGSLGLGVNF